MFADFGETFGERNVSKGEFPREIIEEFNAGAPEGTHYFCGKDGTLHLVPKLGCDFKISGLVPELTKESKEVLGDHPSYDDIIEYSYNSQTPIKLRMLNPGYLRINGDEISVEEVSLSPCHEIKIDENSFSLHPASFPPPFNIVISAENGINSLELEMQRVPNKSINIASFKSNSNSPFSMSCFVDYTDLLEGNPGKVHFDFNVSPQRCKTLSELLNLFYVYESLITGTAKINQIAFEASKTEIKNEVFNPDILDILEKAFEIESVLDLRFNPEDIEIDNSTANSINEIYRCLIEKEPYRSSIIGLNVNYIESEDGQIEKEFEEGEKIALSFSHPCYFEIFNESVTLQSISGLFNMMFDGIAEDGDGNRRIEFINDAEGNGYLSTMLFLSESEMNSYYELHSMEEIMQLLQDATEI